MDNVIVKNAQGEQLNINVARYFRLNGIEYLIFSLNEIDEGGYVKLYISKVNGGLASTIADDVEWNLIKDTIKTIIKSNKDGLALPITDLDVKKLADLQISDQKVFKLNDSLLQLLSANKKVEAYVAPAITETPVIENQPVAPIESLNIGISEPAAPIESVISSQLPVENINSASLNPIVDAPILNQNNFVNDQAPINNNPIPSLDNNSEISDYSLDYKTLYENLLNEKNVLVEENEKYKQIIEQLKKLLNETF